MTGTAERDPIGNVQSQIRMRAIRLDVMRRQALFSLLAFPTTILTHIIVAPKDRISPNDIFGVFVPVPRLPSCPFIMGFPRRDGSSFPLCGQNFGLGFLRDCSSHSLLGYLSFHFFRMCFSRHPQFLLLPPVLWVFPQPVGPGPLSYCREGNPISCGQVNVLGRWIGGYKITIRIRYLALALESFMEKFSLAQKFSLLTRWASDASGSWQASSLAVLLVLSWVGGGFYFGFTSEIYQLVLNSATTAITFVMVFLIQGAQNREQKALQTKLDALLCSIREADSRLIDLEHETDEQIDGVREELLERKAEDA